jgi:hypothetical protein
MLKGIEMSEVVAGVIRLPYKKVWTSSSKKVGAEGGTRTPTGCPIRPSNVRVYQFHHFGVDTASQQLPYFFLPVSGFAAFFVSAGLA